MSGGIKLDFNGGEPTVVAPVSTAWGKLATLLATAREGNDEGWDEMDAIVDDIFPPKTRMGTAELRIYLEYESLRERRIHGEKEELQDVDN